MMNLEKQIKDPVVFILIVLGLLFGAFGELMPEKSKQYIENLFGGYFTIAYWILFTTIVIVLAIHLYKKEKNPPKEAPPKIIPPNLTPTRINKIKTELLKGYKNRLEQKLDRRLPVHLKLFPTDEGSNHYPHFDDDIILNKETTLWDALEEHQHLLLLGSPGSGKTTQLLKLAIKWIEDFEESQPIPILINLASWSNKDQYFDLWLEKALHAGHGFSQVLAKQVIKKQQIFLLLDGLDEIGRKLKTQELQNQLRSNCLKAIDNYISNYNVQYLVICSRQKEYNQTESNAPVKIPLRISPLSPQEIQKALKDTLQAKTQIKNETAARNILDQLKKTPVLEKVLCTPFYYNIALTIFDTRTVEHNLPSNKKALKKYLVEEFIQNELSLKNPIFSKKDSVHYLSWLAYNLNNESNVTFQLTDFSFHSLKNSSRANVFSGILGGVLVGILSWFFFCFSLDWYSTTYISFISSLFTVILLVVFLGFLDRLENIKKINWFNLLKPSIWKNNLFLNLSIKPKHIRKVNLFKLVRVSTWINSFLSELIKSSLIGVSIGLIIDIIKPIDNLIFFWISGLTTGFIIGLIRGLATSITEIQYFEIIKTPFQKFNKEFLFELYQWIIITIVLSIVDFSVQEKKNILLLCKWIPLGILGLLFDIALFNHLILKICLYGENKMPWKWVTFFQYVTKVRLLEQNGGQWRFKHQILQDHFHQLYKQKQSDKN